MLLARLTDFSSSRRGKWIVIALWVLLTTAIVPLAPSIEEVTDNSSVGFLPEGAESTQVVELVNERFPRDGTPAIIVINNPAGLGDDDRAAVRQLNDWLLAEAPANVDRNGVISIFTNPQAESTLLSPDGTTMTLVVNITGEAAEDAFADTIVAIRDKAASLEAVGGPDFRMEVSGPGGLLKDLIEVFSSIDGFLLLVTAVLVLVLLILIYRSPIVAFVPLLSVGWVFSLSSAIGALAADRFGLTINGQASGITTVLLFGAGTDYFLFISSRYREELARVEDKHEAMKRAMRGVGEAIASSAGTVLVATLALLFAILRSTSALGPLLAIAIASMLIAALTLIPAIMALLGRAAFWPFRPRFDPALADQSSAATGGLWSAIAGRVARAPALVLAATAVIFLMMSLGVFRLKQTFDTLTALPEGTESREGFEILLEAFPAGELAPTDLFIVLPEETTADEQLAAIGQLTADLAQEPGVAAVSSAAYPFGYAGDAAVPPVGPDAVAGAIAAIPDPIRQGIDQGNAGGPSAEPPGDEALAQNIGVYAASRRYISPDNGVAQLQITLDQNPYSLTAIEEIPGLRDAAKSAAMAAGLPVDREDVLVGGETATAYDTKVANDRDIRVVLPLILATIGIILGLLLRSVVAPLYLLATIVLSYFATLGLATVVFQDVLGQTGVSSGVPFLLFVFSAALGVDYSIYLMTRVREEVARHELTDGVRRALSRTGGVITSAGIILAGTFAALMTLPLEALFQLGFAVAVGVLIDTFIVRSLMVPSIVLLLGRWNWWPGRIRAETTPSTPAPSAHPAPGAAGSD